MPRTGRTDFFPYLLLLPSIIVLVAVVAWPLLETVRLSFTNASLKPDTRFVGLENYEKIATSRFLGVTGRTFAWMLLSVALKMLLGIVGAVLLNAAIPGRSVFRVLIMPPWIIPIAIGVFAWGWLYHGQFGMFSGLLQRFGLIDQPYEFLARRGSAFLATVVTDVWVGVPFVTLYLLAALQSVPRDLAEAAWVDGASRWYRFRRVTLPLMLPAIASMALLSAIFTFNSFDVIWILTEGGPRNATTTMIIDTYKTAIVRFRFGEGAARAVAVCFFLSLFSLAWLRLVTWMEKRNSGA